ncbi:MAG TPA: hydroxyethylthiazole kinase [Acidimicrobiales bacterium]|nr:hydroxyethylthiazole kinase [Acidimicrobiales bacterium]
MHAEVTWADGRVPAALHEVTERQPLIHCLTNIVVAQFTANVLLAVGASPAMVENAVESGPFATAAGAVLLNLGTLSAEREVAMRSAATAAHEHGRPWVFDPVAVGALAHRTSFAGELLELRPVVVRANASEVLSLVGSEVGGRGVDSLAPSEAAIGAATLLARERNCVVAVSGAVDYVTNGKDVVAISGGSPLLTRITGTGCALGALVAAFVAVENDALFAAAAASAVFKVAAEHAACGNPGPGTFAVNLIDQLASLARGETKRPL